MVDFTNQAIDVVKEATRLDKAGEKEAAYQQYLLALRNFEAAIKYEKHEGRRKTIAEAMERYITRAEEIKNEISNKKKPLKASSGGDDDDSEKAKFKKGLEGAIIREKPNVTWNDVAGLENAKDNLKEAVILPIQFPQLFTGARKPWKGILLYGPPGTGKSFLAKAVATEAKATFFSVSSSDIVSKWMGESEKLVRSLFEMARDAKPSIVFIDEVDSLVTSRSEGESESSRRIKTQFLTELDGVGNAMDGLLVLGATNLPWNIDSAMRRRFERRIFIPLPEEGSRTKMFQLFLKDTPSDIRLEDMVEMGKMTAGFSGSDVANVVRDAIMEPVRRCREATHFKVVVVPQDDGSRRNMYTPCSPGDNGAVEMELMQVQPEQLQPPDVTMKDFKSVLVRFKPSVGKEDLEQYETWTKEFGMEGV
jgi:vacuolar protein-sorting-associated protein 4